MKSVEIDRTKRLRDQPATGHNRLHPDIPPILEVDEGEEVVLETRDGCDGQLGPSATDGRASPRWTPAPSIRSPGPVLVKGAQPGDVLEIEMVDIAAPAARVHGDRARARLPARSLHDPVPGALAASRDGWATSPRAARRADSRRAVHGRDRRRALARAGARVDRARAELPRRAAGWSCRPMPPAPSPARGRAATEGLRTLPPRENGGNFDVKQITKGSTLLRARHGGGRALLRGRRPLRPGRRRGLRHRGRDGRHRRGALPRAEGRGAEALARPALLATATTSRRRSGRRRSVSSRPPACPSATTA